MQRTTERTEGSYAGGRRGLVETLYERTASRPEKMAFVRKVGGEWRGISYAEFWERVRSFASGLALLGVEQGSRVAIISRNRTEWPVTDLATQSLGAIVVPIYPTLEKTQISHILNHSRARVTIVEDEELLKKVEEIKDDLPALEHLVVIDGMCEKAKTFSQVEETGARRPLEDWEEGWRAQGPDDVATIIYTSGTTGPPKGAVLTQGNILSNVEGILDALPISSEDVFLSFLPLSHVFERTCSQFLALYVGGTTYYAESMDKIPENLREVRPTLMLCVPRLYEKMYDRMQRQAAEGSALQRKVFELAVAAGRGKYALEKAGKPLGMLLRVRLMLYDRLVYRKVREALGGRIRFFTSGGAKLEPEIGEFFYAAGVRIVEGYGLTETSPVIACNRLPTPRFGTVGPPIFGTRVRISPGGEVQVRGPGVTGGYLDDPEATAEAFTEDGWFRTGDIGELKDGYLKITDRLKHLIVLSTGKNVAPQPIETALVAKPHISQAVLLGDGRKYVSALIVPDYDAVRKTLGLDATDEELSRDERCRDLIGHEVNSACESFAAYERPKKFALLPRALTHESGELTPTLKVKMRVVREKYADVIEGLYD